MGCVVVVVLQVLLVFLPFVAADGHDYREALSKSILFFEAQRSGYLPKNQRVKWRADSGLHDGKANGVDLVGGYYDAGDNVKFGLPMAFTITMMSWGIIEYGKQMAHSGELRNAMDAVKWGTDYLIKAHPEPNVLYGEVGDGNTDHYCWQRPEDMTTNRQAYRVDPQHPGSDIAGETAAAMAAASIVFQRYNSAYSRKLVSHARQLFYFANKYRGKYDSSITVVQQYYKSFSGYQDELLWAAAWLYQATNNRHYLDFLANQGEALGGTGWAITEFSWDVKYAGVQVLATKILLKGKGGHHSKILKKYQEKADFFVCSSLGKGTSNAQRTPGGLIYRQSWNNMQFVTSAAFLLTVYSDYLRPARQNAHCAAGIAKPSQLLAFAKSQVDYILGDNPRATSYMVGYSRSYPRQVHHRAASIVSFKVDRRFVSCRGGYQTWFGRKENDPNLLDGAIVGGPDAHDNFADQRDNYEQTEPATYNNAPIVGVLARLTAGHRHRKQIFVEDMPVLNESWALTIDESWISNATSPFTIEQNTTASWAERGRTYYRYSVVVTNKSPRAARDLRIAISKLYGPLWGLHKSGDEYEFPKWITELPSGKSFEFVYIHSGSPADVRVSEYTLV